MSSVGLHEVAEGYGRRGWIKRFGIRQVPAGAERPIAEGRLSLASARAPMVWIAIEKRQGQATLTDISADMRVCLVSAQAAIDVLATVHLVEKSTSRPSRYAVKGKCPDWRDFVVGL